MKTTQMTVQGSDGAVSMERLASGTVLIQSTLSEPNGREAIVRWEVDPGISNEDLFEIAELVQERCDGGRGTNSMVHDYYREMQRFQD